MSQCKGRGVFTNKPIRQGEILVVEKAFVKSKHNYDLEFSIQQKNTVNKELYEDLIHKCHMHAQVKGVYALRMSYLYDGTEKSTLRIPPVSIFTHNEYKQYTIPDISFEQI